MVGVTSFASLFAEEGAEPKGLIGRQLSAQERAFTRYMGPYLNRTWHMAALQEGEGE
jgi:hypothetical protein